MKRRLIVIGLVIVASFVLFVCIVSGVVNSSYVHELLLSAVNDALPGTIKFDKLHITFLNGRVELSDGSLTDPSGKQLVGFRRLMVDISLPHLFRRTLAVESVVIEHPQIVLDIDTAGRLTLIDVFLPRIPPDSTVVNKDNAPMPFRLVVRELRIIDGTIYFAVQQEQLAVRASGVSLVAGGEPAAGSGRLSVMLDSVAVEVQEKHLRVHDVAGSMRMQNMNVDAINLRMKTDASSLSFQGTVSSPADNPVVNLSVAAHVALAEIGGIAGLQEDLDGSAELHASIRGPVANPGLNIDVVYHGGTIMGYAVDSLGCRAALTDRNLTLTALHAETRLGDIDISGDVDARTMFPGGFLVAPASTQGLAYKLSISGKRIALKKIVPGISGSAECNMTITGNGVFPDSITASMSMSGRVAALLFPASAGPLEAAVACSAAVMRGTAQVHDLQGNLGSALFALAGTYAISSGEIDAEVNVTSSEPDKLPGFADVGRVSGRIAVKAHVKGTSKCPEAYAAVDADSVAYRGIQVGKVRLTAGLDRSGTVRVQNFTLAKGNSHLKCTGSARVLDRGVPLPADRMTFDCSAVCPELHAGDFVDSVDGLQRSAVAAFSATLHGDVLHPQATVELRADSIDYRNIRIGNIALAGSLEPEGTARVQRLTCENGRSKVSLLGWAHLLDSGKVVPPEQIEFAGSLAADELYLGDFFDSVDGTVAMSAALTGTVRDLQGRAGLTANDVVIARQKISRIDLDAEIAGQRAIIQTLDVTVAPGQKINAAGWASLKDSFDLTVSSAGIHLDRIAALDKIDSLDGIVSVDLQAGGGYNRPDVRGALTINGIRMGSLPLEDIGLQMKLHDQQVELQGTAGGNLHAGLNLATNVFDAELTVDNLLLTPYLVLAGKELDGSMTAAMRVSGDIDALDAITGTLNIGSLRLGYRQQPIIETHGLNVSLSEKRYDVPEFMVSLAGAGVVKGHVHGLLKGPHDAGLKGTVPLAIVRYFVPELGDIGGQVDVDAFFKGTTDAAELNADVLLRDINLTIPGVSQRLHSLNGKIRADSKSVRFDTLVGNVDEGNFQLTGVVLLDDFSPSVFYADVILNALPLSVDGMLDLVFDGQLHLQGTPDTSDVNGDLVLLDGLYYHDFVINPLAMVTERKRPAAPPAAGLTAPFVRNMRCDVGIKPRSTLRVDNNLTQLNIAPDLHLMGTVASPLLEGRAVVEQGTISYLRQTFTVDQGIIDFVNPYAIEPQLDIRGSVPVGNRVIRLTLSGAPENLAFSLSAFDKSGIEDETLEDQDVLALLILGKTTSELQGDIKKGDIVQSNQQMLAALAASTFGEDIRKAAGLDMLEVVTAGETSDRIAVTVGKQLTRRFGTRYTVESENGGILQRATAEYRLLQNLYFAGFQDTKGVFGGAVNFTWEKR